MGRGSRHSKNAGTMGSESMTYAEMKGLGYGTVKERLGKVTIKGPWEKLHVVPIERADVFRSTHM